MPIPLTEHRSKQYGLQLLRVIAAVLVCVHHATQAEWAQYRSLKPWIGGSLGVDLFFVLSGYVMVSSSARLLALPRGWIAFAQRRIVRVVPMYWLATSILLLTRIAVPHLFPGEDALVSRAVRSYLFLPTLASNHTYYPLLIVGWTLNFEVLFYLIFGIALFARWNVFVLVGTVFAALSAGALVHWGTHAAWQFYLDPIILEFLFGMLLAHARFRATRAGTLLALPVALAMFALLLWPSQLGEVWRPVRMGLPAAAIVGCLLLLEPKFQRMPRWILFLADASYAIYLFHIMIVSAAVRVFHLGSSMASQLTAIALSVLVAVGAGALLHRWMELPLLRWLRECWPLHGAATVQGARSDGRTLGMVVPTVAPQRAAG